METPELHALQTSITWPPPDPDRDRPHRGATSSTSPPPLSATTPAVSQIRAGRKSAWSSSPTAPCHAWRSVAENRRWFSVVTTEPRSQLAFSNAGSIPAPAARSIISPNAISTMSRRIATRAFSSGSKRSDRPVQARAERPPKRLHLALQRLAQPPTSRRQRGHPDHPDTGAANARELDHEALGSIMQSRIPDRTLIGTQRPT